MPDYPFIPIFWNGKHKNKGTKKDWTAEDVQKIFSATQELSDEKIPFTIDHPVNDLPVIGWTSKKDMKLTLIDGKAIIEAKPTEFSEPALKAIKESGRKKVSIAFKPDLSIKHIGLVEKPAVTDLPQIPFSESEELITFSLEGEDELFMDYQTAWSLQSAGRLFQGFRDYLIEKEGLEVADKILSQWEIDVLKKNEADQNNENNFSLNSKEGGMPDNPIKSDEMDQTITNFKADISAKEAEIEAKNKRIAELEAAQRNLEFAQFVDNPELQGRVTPANRDSVLRIMTALHGGESYSFSEGEGENKKDVTATALDEFKGLLKSLPKQVTFGEYAQGGAPADDSSDALKPLYDEINKGR